MVYILCYRYCYSLNRVIESVSKALVRQEKKGKYITIQTTTILKLIDNIRESEMHDKSSSGLDKADTKDESAGFVAVPPRKY